MCHCVVLYRVCYVAARVLRRVSDGRTETASSPLSTRNRPPLSLSLCSRSLVTHRTVHFIRTYTDRWSVHTPHTAHSIAERADARGEGEREEAAVVAAQTRQTDE